MALMVLPEEVLQVCLPNYNEVQPPRSKYSGKLYTRMKT